MFRETRLARQGACDAHLPQLVRTSIRHVFQPGEADSPENRLGEMRHANDVDRSWPGCSLERLPDRGVLPVSQRSMEG